MRKVIILIALAALLAGCAAEPVATAGEPSASAAEDITPKPLVTIVPTTPPPTPTPKPRPPEDSLYLFSRSGILGRGQETMDWGAMNERGEIVIEPKYLQLAIIDPPFELLPSERDAKIEYMRYSNEFYEVGGDYTRYLYGLMDASGREITECKYLNVYCYYGKIAFALMPDYKTFYMIDTETGEELQKFITRKYDYANFRVFDDKLIMFFADEKGTQRIVAIDGEGNVLREMSGYYPVTGVYDGYSGEPYISPDDPAVMPMRDIKSEKIGFVDSELNWIMEPRFYSISRVNKDGVFAAMEDKTKPKYGYFNLFTNEWEAEPEYDSADAFAGGVAIVAKTGEYTDVSGAKLIAHLQGMINSDYELIVPCEYTNISIMNERIMATKYDKEADKPRFSFYDMQGMLLYDVVHDYLDYWDYSELFADRFLVFSERTDDYSYREAVYLLDIRTGEETRLDTEALCELYGDFEIEYVNVISKDKICLNIVRESKEGMESSYSTLVLDENLNPVIEARDIRNVPFYMNGRYNYMTANDAEPPIRYMSIVFVNNPNTWSYAFYDKDFNLLLDNVARPRMCDGYRIIGRRGFYFGMMDYEGEWIYKESIFAALND